MGNRMQPCIYEECMVAKTGRAERPKAQIDFQFNTFNTETLKHQEQPDTTITETAPIFKNSNRFYL